MDTYDLYCEIAHDGDYSADTEYTPVWLPEPRNTELEAWLDMVAAQGVTCPDCGQPLALYVQTGRKPAVIGSCWTAGCTLHSTTRSLSFWTADDETERDIYRAMNRKAVAS